MADWSTDAISSRERFSFWREAICRSLFNISIEAPSEDAARFSGRIEAWKSGPLRFATCKTTAYQSIRSPRDISSAPADHYTMILQVRGQTAVSQGDDSITIQENDIGITDGQLPFNAAFSDGERLMAVVPRATIDRQAPWLSQRAPRKLASSSSFVDLARRHMLQLTSKNLSESAASVLTENLCNLIALASANDVTLNRLEPELQTEAMLTFCRQNLHDAELSPQLVATRFGISVRTLHLRFAKMGQSFSRWLLENRLDSCRKSLRDPYQQNCNISEIAYRWGFNDLSHFNKAFRVRFGTTPSETRAEFHKLN